MHREVAVPDATPLRLFARAQRRARGRTSAAVLAVLMLGGLVTAPPATAETPQQLDFNAVPGAPWEANGQVSATGGVLHVGPNGSLRVGFNPDQRGDWWGTVLNELGWTMSTRARLDSTLAGLCADELATINVADHTINVWLSLGTDGVCVRASGMAPIKIAMDTQSAFHTYKIDVKREHVELSVDGTEVAAFDAPRSNSFIGAWIEFLSLPDHQVHWDFLSYDVTASLPPCTIMGTSGNDVLNGTTGNDVICAGDGNDVVQAANGNDVVLGGNGDDQIFGGGGHDVLLGDDGFDFLRGDIGNDTMYGGTGGDTFSASTVADGTDLMLGGDGLDTVSYERRTDAVRVRLDDIANDGAPGENDRAGIVPWQTVTWPDIEDVAGGDGDDVITGNLLTNVLVGGDGADVVRGKRGADTIDVRDDAAGDQARAGGGIDVCVADSGDVVNSCES